MQRMAKRYYLFDHKILFFIGFIFYLLTPILLGKIDAFHEYPGVDLFQGFFNRIPTDKIRSYLIITFSWLPAFYLGHFCFTLLKPYKKSLVKFSSTFETRSAPYIAIVLCIFLVLFTYVSRASLFGGGVYDVGPRGKLSTLIAIFNFFLIYQLISTTKVSKLLVIGTILNALILLVAGGRLTALQSLTVFLIYKTSFASQRWKTIHLLLIALIGLIVGGAIGIWRVKSSFSIERAGFSFLAEPLFSWFSSASFLVDNDIPMFNFPKNFLSSFFNLVPNTLFSLREYVVSPGDMGYKYQNPFGADSIWTTLVINFGAAGSGIFIFITGFMLNFLRHLSEDNRFWATYYMLVCALLPFEFFRTGFFILNKQLFFNFMLLPALILLTLKFIQYFQNEPANIHLKASPHEQEHY